MRHLPTLFTVLCLLLLGAPLPARGQHPFREVEDSWQRYAFEFTVDAVEGTLLPDGTSTLTAEGFAHRSHRRGHPRLPVWNQLTVIPEGATPVVAVETDETETVALSDIGCRTPLQCVGAPSFKHPVAADSLPADPPLKLVEVSVLGHLRGMRIARITVAPFEVVGDSVRLHRHIRASVTYRDADMAQTHDRQRRYRSPYFRIPIPGTSAKDYDNGLAFGDIPPVYLIVSRPEFEQGLRPLVRWKRQKGFRVEEWYVDDTDRDALKARLQSRYDSASAQLQAPTFVLLVGDIDQILPFVGQHGLPGVGTPYMTDLPYADFTDDYLPDVLLGRLSANDTAQLRAVVEKTLAYEQFRLTNPAYLDQALLMAGNEHREQAPLVTNGETNYLEEAFAPMATHCFRNPGLASLPDSLAAPRKDSVMALMAQGMGTVVYSGHGTYKGWKQPDIPYYDLAALPANGSPAFVVNNCCLVNAFEYPTCFSEALLRTPDGGAVGVIGATSETLWDEDYCWSVGAKAGSLHPQYDSAAPGAFDRLLHRHNEPFAQQAHTQGQVLLAGNYAVSQSGSPYDVFYWETYQLMGDPSLMPYIGVPHDMTLTVADSVAVGDTQMGLAGTPGAYVAAMQDSTLLGVCTLDASGLGTLRLSTPLCDSIVTLTATLHNHKPVIDTVEVDGYVGAGATTAEETAAPRIYPNPANEQVYIDLRNCRGSVRVDIYDPMGRKMDEFSCISPTLIQYSTHKLRLGISCVVIHTDTQIFEQRLIITK